MKIILYSSTDALAKFAALFTCLCQMAFCGEESQSLNPNQVLKATITQYDLDTSGIKSQRPWVRFDVKNTGTQKSYYYMAARHHGMNITVTDENGKTLELTQKGKDLASLELPEDDRRVGAFSLTQTSDILLPMGDICKMENGKRYKVAVKWTLRVYEANPFRDEAARAKFQTITLDAGEVEVLAGKKLAVGE